MRHLFLAGGAAALVLAAVIASTPSEPVDVASRAALRAKKCFGFVVNLDGGTAGDDNIIGRLGRDVAHGRRGNDNIFGLPGADRLCGGRGDDFINGGDGLDRIDGGRGYDICREGERVRRCEEFRG